MSYDFAVLILKSLYIGSLSGVFPESVQVSRCVDGYCLWLSLLSKDDVLVQCGWFTLVKMVSILVGLSPESWLRSILPHPPSTQ